MLKSDVVNQQPVATSSPITQQYETSTWIFNIKIQCNITVRIVKMCSYKDLYVYYNSLHFALLYVVQLMYMQSKYWLILICY